MKRLGLDVMAVALMLLCCGCAIGVYAPAIQWGNENAMLREQSGQINRGTTAQQEVAHKTAKQEQHDNEALANMDNAKEAVRQVGLKQAQEAAQAQAQGEATTTTQEQTGTDQTGQEGGETIDVSPNP